MKTDVILSAAILACLCVTSEARFIGPFTRRGLKVQPRTVKAGLNQQPRVIVIKEDTQNPATAQRAHGATRSAYTRPASTVGHGNGYDNFLNNYLLADALDVNHPELAFGLNQYGSPFSPSNRGGRNSYDPYYAAHVLDALDAQPVGRGPVIVV